MNKLRLLTEFCDLLAYCLMPDHFHLMIYVPAGSEGVAPLGFGKRGATGQTAWSSLPGAPQIQILSRKVGTIQSSYTQAINKARRTAGSLFQPKAKAKCLIGNHLFNCFHYIHQNPLKARLVKRIEDWPYASFHEYLSNQSNICNTDRARKFIDLPSDPKLFYIQSYQTIQDMDEFLIDD